LIEKEGKMSSSLIIRAATLAEELHKGQKRKASIVPGVPYLSHLMEVAGMVQGAGGSEVAIAAAWLHDAVEDTDAANAIQRIAEECGQAVLDLVLECTEIGTKQEVKAPWKARKDAYIEHLLSVSAEALLISTADKLQSLRDLKRVVRKNGHSAYLPLVESAPEPERRHWTLWFNENVGSANDMRLSVFEQTGEWTPMLDGVQALLDDFHEIIFWLQAH